MKTLQDFEEMSKEEFEEFLSICENDSEILAMNQSQLKLIFTDRIINEYFIKKDFHMWASNGNLMNCWFLETIKQKIEEEELTTKPVNNKNRRYLIHLGEIK